MKRIDGRAANQLRPIKFTRNWLSNAEGSVLVEFGETRVIGVLLEGEPTSIQMPIMRSGRRKRLADTGTRQPLTKQEV